jgi:HEAT repeat protein
MTPELAQRLFDAWRADDCFALIEMLENPEARAAALRYIGMIACLDAADAAIRCLGDDDTEVRVAAAHALGGIRARRSVDVLISAASSDPELLVRLWAVDSLSLIADTNAIRPVVELLDDSNVRVKKTAVIALSRFGDRSAARALRAKAKELGLWRRRPYLRAARVIEERETSR